MAAQIRTEPHRKGRALNQRPGYNTRMIRKF